MVNKHEIIIKEKYMIFKYGGDISKILAMKGIMEIRINYT